ncbi:tRNA(Arg) A34 adenosine deaminase TadA [Isoptericola sp. CG 20/1183]|uniref:tRNA(Arg) A34 adenosine deaminase TadA n=1 Tax=Isoptericola halotolerans TaxID=300560 RepID=A0ABX5ELA0_9MICO|nr:MULTISPECIES: nucleoside deaminase [Isoptericola]PRZ09642.1 tRNA(Arg) A34 adenosine deaminase TadA [Isoptericola sp. CG 20/1183]PRZ10443.1 tRNA(Arg) A34 adenosine deaminase TadA [Isoptericola halotolerans]
MSVPTSAADREHLAEALRIARETLADGNKPFGAVLVAADGRVLATGRNTAAQTGDPTSHAELDAVRAVAPADRGAVVGATMFASGEPCPMCAAALVWSGVARIVFGTAAADIRAVTPGPPGFRLRCAEVVASSDATIEVVGPALGDEGLQPFRELPAR